MNKLHALVLKQCCINASKFLSSEIHEELLSFFYLTDVTWLIKKKGNYQTRLTKYLSEFKKRFYCLLDDDECDANTELCQDGTCENLNGRYQCSCNDSQGYVLFTTDGMEGFDIPESEKPIDSVNNTLRINHTCVRE